MKTFTLLSAILLLIYPFAVYYGLSQWGISAVAGVLALLFILRVLGGNQTRLRELKYIAWLTGSAGIVLTLLAFIFKSSHWFTYYPVVVNLFMMSLFAHSLFQEKSMIERFARLQDPELPMYAVRYTRNVTKCWCLFFMLNACLAFVTTFMSMQIWTIYNGLISYLLAGCLFTFEYVVRLIVKRKNEKITEHAA